MTVLSNLLQITIYSTILYAAVMLFKFFFKNHASPVLMYLVWFLLVARLLIPVTPDPGFSLITLPAVQTEQQLTAADSSVAPGLADTALPAENTVISSETTSSSSNDVNTRDQPPALLPAASGQPAIDYIMLLLLIWIAGASFFLIRFSIESVLLKKRLILESSPPPSRVKLLADEIISELNLQKNIRIAVLNGINSPALSVNFRPVVMLPKQLIFCNDPQIKYALRHELMHLKRKDHLVCILLSILRAAYWFHPVMWLILRQMKMDMETACDCMVVKSMSPDQKKGYAKTILNMYSGEAQTGLLLGMGLENTRKTAERRIRGIFTRPRSGNKAKVWATLLTAVMLIACFTTACQPVQEPPEQITAAPDQSGLAASPAQASAVSAAAPYQVPTEWKQTVQFGQSTINVNTPIVMPVVSAYPVLRIEQAYFTQDRMNQLVMYFAENHLTTEKEKSQIENALQQAHNQDYLNMGIGDENNHYMFSVQNSGDEFYPYTLFTFQSGSDYRTETFYNQNKESILESEDLPGIRNVDYEKCLSEIKITKEDALAQAQKVMDDLQIKDMQLVDAQKAVLFTFKKEYTSIDSNLPDRGGYSFEYTRSFGGISGYNLVNDVQPDSQGEYTPAYPLESIEIVVTEHGVEFFNWKGYCNVVDTEEKNTSLLPFEQIQQNLIKQIDYKRSMLLDDKSMKVNSIDVTSAELRMGYIQAEDDFFQTLMVPVWVFETREDFMMSNGKEMTNYLPYMFDARNGKQIDLSWVSSGSGAQQ